MKINVFLRIFTASSEYSKASIFVFGKCFAKAIAIAPLPEPISKIRKFAFESALHF